MSTLLDVDWSDLPVPEDDGAADHLLGRSLPSVPLEATGGDRVDPAALKGLVVIYVYPMTGRPDRPLPEGWDMIPGARGCSPQSCAFRDHFADLRALGVDHLFGLSVQETDWQAEAAARLHLPFPLLSDAGLRFADALALPRFETDGMTLLKRLTLIARDGRIEHALYPVFPPDANARQVEDWLRNR